MVNSSASQSKLPVGFDKDFLSLGLRYKLEELFRSSSGFQGHDYEGAGS